MSPSHFPESCGKPIKHMSNCRYTLVGNGRVANHLAHYFQLLNLNFNQWSRASNQVLAEVIQDSDRILLLISDTAIKEFWEANPCLQQKTVIHCSGALTLDTVFSAHPLTSFSQDCFDLNFYQTVPFCIEAEGKPFAELLPGLPNPHFCIPRAHKALYHALCVMSGNFTVLLWQKFFAELENRWQVPREIALPYLQSVTQNLQQNSRGALTGPLARGDHLTIQKNLMALAEDPFEKIYAAFVAVFQKDKPNHKEQT